MKTILLNIEDALANQYEALPATEKDRVQHLVQEVLAETIKKEVAISVEEEPISNVKRTYEQAVKFYRDNAVDFSKIEKWRREDLYE